MGQQPAFYVVHLSVHTTRELIIDQQLPRNILYLPVTVAGVKYLRIRVTRRQSRIFDGHCTRPLATMVPVTGHWRVFFHMYVSISHIEVEKQRFYFKTCTEDMVMWLIIAAL